MTKNFISTIALFSITVFSMTTIKTSKITNNNTINEIAQMYKEYLSTINNWQALIENVTPKITGCGDIYELKNPLNRTTESFAIADMRRIAIAAPHYHTNGETEIYFIIEGEGIVVVGNKKHHVKKGSIIITPPMIAHYTIVHKNLVMVVVNTPPFNPKNNISLTQTNEDVYFDYKMFENLKK